jgi:hypothetical protein
LKHHDEAEQKGTDQVQSNQEILDLYGASVNDLLYKYISVIHSVKGQRLGLDRRFPIFQEIKLNLIEVVSSFSILHLSMNRRINKMPTHAFARPSSGGVAVYDSVMALATSNLMMASFVF